MDPINVRFKELRIECKKSQEEWGKILGLTKSGISDIERGRRNVTEQHLIMLKNWTEKPISIDWLKTGNGEKFIRLSQNEKIADFMTDLLKEEEDSFKKRLIEALSALDASDWEDLERITHKIIKKDQENP